MATVREIRRKLHSIQNIEKITQTMEMVAASRLRRAQTKAEMSCPYFLKLKEILNRLVSISHDFVHPLINKRKVQKIAVIIIAGDRGLCGAYNQNVFSAAEKWLKNYQSEQVELILLGRKTIDYFSRKPWKIHDKIAEWGGKITYDQIEEFMQNLMQKYLKQNFDAIWLVYTHYINLSRREVIIDKLLNIEINDVKQEKKNFASSYLFEPNIEEVFAQILPRYCITKFQSVLNEAYASELAARIFSMRAATKNAEEMIDKLTLLRNKIRQASITRELLEITAGVESLK